VGGKTYKTKNGRGLSVDNFSELAYPDLKECVLCCEPSRTFDMLLVLGEGVAVLFGLCHQHQKLPPEKRKEAVLARL
jgi:hypothetical protein